MTTEAMKEAVDIANRFDFSSEDDLHGCILDIRTALTSFEERGRRIGLEEAAKLLDTAKVGQTFNQHNFADAIRVLIQKGE